MAQGPEPPLVVRQVRADGDAVLMQLTGELDVDAVRRLDEAVVDVVLGGDRGSRVLLDLSGVTYCGRDSAFTLLGMCITLKALGVDVTITELSTMARIAVHGAGLERRLPLRRR
ncbi:STAS domain-containing protein [Streptomyces minutiscleroticus]|uniref:STAS domain-containing protein n=1 Tax=Streptomyces minutiscleroticus TaxID=68238 RepID=A0A918KDE3_9ACTN|nr:STAS domain-containing protein [Streptomyces minutiscleroticus]GGX58882.1 hypothetical protein GCM10010358_11290 [Streptomyces minutiscleroticus]